MTRKKSDSQNDRAVQKAFDELSAQVDNLREDLSGLVGAVTDYGTAQGQRAAEQASGVARDAVGHSQETSRKQARRFASQAGELQAQADDFVSRQPQVALGIAVGAGFLVGLWAARK